MMGKKTHLKRVSCRSSIKVVHFVVGTLSVMLLSVN